MNRLAPQLAFITLATVAACKHTESNYCEDVPVTHNCMDKMDADVSCSSNSQCSGATPVCDVGGSKTCVQCTTGDANACTGATPVCGANNMCERCTMHSQCAGSSNVCLPDGTCADAAQVAYVEAGKTGDCSKATPCGSLAEGIAKPAPFIKVTGALNAAATTTISKAVTILADPNASVDTSADATPVLTISTSAADVKIFDLKITGGTMAGGVGVSVPTGGTPIVSLTRVKLEGNAGGGLTASGGTVTVTRSTVTGNTGGGIAMSMAGVVTLTNNFIYRNGSGTATSGGLVLRPSAGSKVEFNTIVDNQSANGSSDAGGVFCDTAGFAPANNIIFRNTGGTTGLAQTFGICSFAGSFVAAGTTPVDNSLMFKSPNTAPFNYHLTDASPSTVRNALTSCTGTDFDGQMRPLDGACDLGADERLPSDPDSTH